MSSSIDEQLLQIEIKRRHWRELLDRGAISVDSYDAMITASDEEERMLVRATVINPKDVGGQK